MADAGSTPDGWQERVLERLLSLKREDESDAAFARRLGLQPQHLSNYRSGRHSLSLTTALRIARTTGLSLDWLLRGAGEPFRPVEEDGDGEAASPREEIEALSLPLRRRVDRLRETGRLDDEPVERFEQTLDELIEPLTS